MDKQNIINSEKKNSNKVRYIFKNYKESYYLQHAKELSQFLKNSSSYWKGSFSNMKNNLLSCSRPDTLDEDTQNKHEMKQVSVARESSDQIQKNISELKLKEVKSEPSHIITTNNIISTDAFVSSCDDKNKQPQKIFSDIKQNSQFCDKNLHSNNDPLLEIGNYSAHTESNNHFVLDYDPSENLTLNRKFWTQEEDEKLIHLVNNSIGRNWKKISQLIFNKTPQQCAYRYNKLISNLNKRKWSRNEDILLIESIEIYGYNWREISRRMEGRTLEEIKERFEKKLDPKLKRCKFKKEEDEMILSLFEKYGNKWEEIAKYFVDRSANMIKNRFYSHLRKKISKNISCIDTSQNENNLDLKSLTSSTQNNLSSKEIRLEENQSHNHFNTSPFEFQNKNLALNLNNFDCSMDGEMIFPKISDNIGNGNNSGSIFNKNIGKLRNKKLKTDKNQEAYPDKLGYFDPSYDDISMKLDLPDITYRSDCFNQNVDGIFNYNINGSINTFPNNNNPNMMLDAENSLNSSNTYLYRNNSFDFNQMSHTESKTENTKNNNLITTFKSNLKKSNSSSKVHKHIENSSFKNEKDKAQLIPYKRLQSSEMNLDDTEANNIPKDLIVIDTESPKEEFSSDDPDKNFDKHYENIFRFKKLSFEQENIHDNIQSNFNQIQINVNITNNSQKNFPGVIPNSSKFSADNSNNTLNNKNIPSNNLNITNQDNDALYKQYKMLEEVFKKVTDICTNQINTFNIGRTPNSKSESIQSNKKNLSEIKNFELMKINNNLNLKTEILSNNLKNLENHYKSLNTRWPLESNTSKNANQIKSNEAIRDSLMNKIDILIDLINITKKKISLIQEMENEIN